MPDASLFHTLSLTLLQRPEQHPGIISEKLGMKPRTLFRTSVKPANTRQKSSGLIWWIRPPNLRISKKPLFVVLLGGFRASCLGSSWGSRGWCLVRGLRGRMLSLPPSLAALAALALSLSRSLALSLSRSLALSLSRSLALSLSRALALSLFSLFSLSLSLSRSLARSLPRSLSRCSYMFYVCVHTYVDTYIHTYMYMYIYVYVYVYVYVDVDVDADVCIYIYILIHVCIYTHV